MSSSPASRSALAAYSGSTVGPCRPVMAPRAAMARSGGDLPISRYVPRFPAQHLHPRGFRAVERGFDQGFHHRVDLLQHQNAPGGLGVTAHQFHRKGPDGGQFEHAHRVFQAQQFQGLPAAGQAVAAGDDQQFGIFGAGVRVEGRGLKLLPDPLQPLQGHDVVRAPEVGVHGRLRVRVGPGLPGRRQGVQFDDARSVRQPGIGTQKHVALVFPGQVEAIARHFPGFPHVGGLQHGGVRKSRLPAGVGFVAAGVGVGIVAHHHHHGAPLIAQAGEAQMGEKVQGHGQPGVLHGREAVEPGDRRGGGALAGHLLVGGPFHVQPALGGHP